MSRKIVKRCHWCAAVATGTALDALYENGRLVSWMGGRHASCGEPNHGSGYIRWARTA